MTPERCNRCNRRKSVSFRRWMKPSECKHYQKTFDKQIDSENSSCDVFQESMKGTNTKNQFLKFWRTKLIYSSVRSLQRYFGRKVTNDSFIHKSDKLSSCSTTELNRDLRLPQIEDKNTRVAELFRKSSKCQHADGHSVLRGHHQHSSMETCALYCQLSKHGWYWGGVTAREAEELLAGQHDNVYLVRDSYHSRYLLCVSFRCVGRTLHARLRHADGLFSLNNETFVTPSSISDHCAKVAVVSGFFEVPVRLARPLNRFAKLNSLQLLCRFVIRQSVPSEKFTHLPLPHNLVRFISTGSDYIIPQ